MKYLIRMERLKKLVLQEKWSINRLRDHPRLITCKTPVDRNAERFSAINLEEKNLSPLEGIEPLVDTLVGNETLSNF